MAGLSLAKKPFNLFTFEALIERACGLKSGQPPPQVRYLLSYLLNGEIAARVMWVEHPYVDRHFLTEYQGYYATALRPPPSTTTRVHFFFSDVDPREVAGRLADADSDARKAIRKELQSAYIGFVVLRPLATAPIGRTVLRTYDARPSRCYGPRPSPHRVHVLGLTLKVHGIQFHQQDQAVGACATAAVWCSLAAVMRRDGGRAPTPLEVTTGAHAALPTARVLPAVSGLTLDQMAAAVNAVGYSPDVFKANDHAGMFLWQLTTYLRSGFPAVLQVLEAGQPDGHAITVVGFRTSDDDQRVEDIEFPMGANGVIRAAGVTRLYAHDDRLGPYARMILIPQPSRVPRAHSGRRFGEIEARLDVLEGKDPIEEAEGDDLTDNIATMPSIAFKPNGTGFDEFEQPMEMYAAIVPLYPKIRITARDLQAISIEVWPVVRMLAGEQGRDAVFLEGWFSHAGRYLEGLYELSALEAGRVVEVVSTLHLSRYVGVLRFNVREAWLVDVVCDATDIHRPSAKWGSVLAVIPAATEDVDSLRAGVASMNRDVMVL